MPIPVRFYSITPEEYERIRKELEQGSDGSEESEQRIRELEGGIFFVENRVNEGGTHEEGEDGSTK